MTASPESILDALDAYIVQARDLLATGQEVQLAGMEDEAARLIAAVEAVGDMDRARCELRIRHIVHALDALQQQMRGRQGEIAQALQGVPGMRKAYGAYAAADASVLQSPEEEA